jgi:hypothetical protein
MTIRALIILVAICFSANAFSLSISYRRSATNRWF